KLYFTNLGAVFIIRSPFLAIAVLVVLSAAPPMRPVALPTLLATAGFFFGRNIFGRRGAAAGTVLSRSSGACGSARGLICGLAGGDSSDDAPPFWRCAGI